MAVSKRKRQELLHAAGTFWSFLFLAHIPQSSWQWAPLILQGCSQSEANANNGRCPMKSTPITISINLILGFLWSSTTCPTRLWWNAERDHFEQSTLSCWKRYQTLCQHQTIQHWTLLFQCRHFLRTKIWRESQEIVLEWLVRVRYSLTCLDEAWLRVDCVSSLCPESSASECECLLNFSSDSCETPFERISRQSHIKTLLPIAVRSCM